LLIVAAADAKMFHMFAFPVTFDWSTPGDLQDAVFLVDFRGRHALTPEL